MKRTISLIYRLIYLLLCAWALFDVIGLTAPGRNILNYAAILHAIAFFVILSVFICTLNGTLPRWLSVCKRFVTFAGALLLVINLPLFRTPFGTYWMLALLLPALLVCDAIFFDKNGAIRLYELLGFLLAAALILGLLWLIGNRLFGLSLSDLFPGLGLDGLWQELLGKALGIGLLFYLLGKIADGTSKPGDLVLKLLRLIYLLAEAIAFYIVSEKSAVGFASQLNRYELFVNLLCFAFVFVVFLIKGTKTTDKTLSRLRLCFLYLALSVLVIHLWICPLTAYHGFVQWLFLVINPAYLFVDFLFFGTKRSARWFDPLWWLAVPAAFVLVIVGITGMTPVFYTGEKLLPLLEWGLGTGYALFLLDSLAAKIK